jgi:hypothetical protein
MKRLLAMLMCVSLCTVLGFGTTGCGKKTEKDTPKKDADTPKKDTPVKDTPKKDTPVKDTPVKDTPAKDTPPKKDVSLSVTADKDVTVKQGDKGEVTAKVALGKSLEGADLKVEVKDKNDKAVDDKDLKAAVSKLEKGEAKVTITVGEKAAPGDYVVTIWATAEGAKDASAAVKLKVEKK